MCGIAGFYRPGGLAEDDASVAVRMADTITHRGPDDQGTWLDSRVGIALGHRRLSVLDLSVAGRQPMCSASGRYVLVFNGEIYNHLDLRRELERAAGVEAWRGRSDTETLLAAFETWGVEGSLSRTVGMFAFALWDRKRRNLVLARDRLGEKPVYYGWQGRTFLFGSELKALRAHPSFGARIDRRVLSLYLQRGYVPAPYSIYDGIYKLLPGTVLTLPADCPGPSKERLEEYWSLTEVAEAGLSDPLSGSDAELLSELQAHLQDAVASQCIADVPLGAFLSGGIDSSAVVSIMQSQSSRPVKTFTIGFSEADYQEAQHAKAVAKHLGTDHTELYLTADDAMALIPELPSLYDEPFGDSSAIPTYLVSTLARESVTVSLSGDGGDELFGGYPRYHRMDQIWRFARRVPSWAGRLVTGSLELAPRRWRDTPSWRKASRTASYLSAATDEECYQAQLNHCVAGAQLLSTPQAPDWPRSEAFGKGQHANMMYHDTMTYLPDDLLVKVDRASMGVSLETRVPMLDHRLVTFAWRLPMHAKIRNGNGKWLLKELVRKYIPQDLIARPKMGFGVPIMEWAAGPLREWAESLLNEPRLRREGFFDADAVSSRWRRHVKGGAGAADDLWHILAFQAWLTHTSQ